MRRGKQFTCRYRGWRSLHAARRGGAAKLDQIRALVQARTAPSVSGFVQHAVAVALDDIAGWGAMLADALRQTGGPLSDDERAWADDVLGSSTRPAA